MGPKEKAKWPLAAPGWGAASCCSWVSGSQRPRCLQPGRIQTFLLGGGGSSPSQGPVLSRGWGLVAAACLPACLPGRRPFP